MVRMKITASRVRWVVTVVLTAWLLAGCPSGSSGGGGTGY